MACVVCVTMDAYDIAWFILSCKELQSGNERGKVIPFIEGSEKG